MTASDEPPEQMACPTIPEGSSENSPTTHRGESIVDAASVSRRDGMNSALDVAPGAGIPLLAPAEERAPDTMA